MIVRLLAIAWLIVTSASYSLAASDQQVANYPALYRAAGELPAALTLDRQGYAYLVGVLTNPAGGHAPGALYVAKIDPSGKSRIYTAYLGGSGLQRATGIAVDEEGDVYIAGYTSSTDFPVLNGVQKASGGGLDAFVAKLDPKGQAWLYSTLLGGSGDDLAQGIALDPQGNAYITGATSSGDFPLRNAAQTARSAGASGFLAEIASDGATLLHATYLGGAANSSGNSIAVDSSGAVYIAGAAADEGGEQRAFLLKTAADGSAPAYFRLLDGGRGATSIAVDSQGNVYVAGRGQDAGQSAFAAKFSAAGDRVYSTAVAGTEGETAPSIAADAQGNAYIVSGRAGILVKLSSRGDRQLVSAALPAAGSRSAGVAVTPSGAAITAAAGPWAARVSTCSFWLSQSQLSVAAGGGAGSVAVQTSPECGWEASSTAQWIAVAKPADGGSFTYRAAANTGPARTARIAIGGETVTITQAAGTSRPNPIRQNPGFRTASLPPCDDCSSPEIVDPGFTVNFYGRTWSQVWVNANGNITFDAPNSSYTPAPMSTLALPMIAPFWADADTRAAGAIQYGRDTIDGRAAFGVTWSAAGPYAGNDAAANDFQLVLIDRSDLGPGFFDIEMNYASLTWDTGAAASRLAARAGFTNGAGAPGTWRELPGSGERGALLDGGSDSLLGRHTFHVRPVSSSTPAPSVSAPAPFASATASAPAVSRPASSPALKPAVGRPLPRQAAAGTITEYRIPISSSSPFGITSGPDGALWFTDWAGFIGRATTVPAFTEIPDAATDPYSIVTGPDGALWFTDTNNSKIGRITTSGTITEYATPTTGSAPHFITVGPDNNLWFSEYSSAKIGKITTAGEITEYPCPHAFDEPETIVAGPDGNLWFAALNPSSNYIGRITTSGTITPFAISTNSSEPVGIALGGDGNLWFTEYNGNKIGKITTAGGITEYPLSSTASQPYSIVAGPDGALWFTQRNTGQIGTITTAGAITEYPVPTANSLPIGITVGSDNAIWFTESNTGKLGRVVTSATNPPVLSIAKSHTGNFTPGQQGATYTVTVSNVGGGPTSGAAAVTVTENPPAGLTLKSMAGTGWTCPPAGTTCTRNGVLDPGTNYPEITVTVDVAAGAASPQVNFVSVTGGGFPAVASFSDSTVINSAATLGTITEFKVPVSGTEPFAIAPGPDGNLWFTDWAGYIGSITTNGSITLAPDAASNPVGIVTGPDGALWFTDSGNSKIGRISTNGTITEYATPTSGSVPHFIVVGPDQNLWFTEYSAGKIGKITTAGVITEYSLPHAYDNPQGITVGPDGALWFAAYNPSSNYLGRITTAGAMTDAFAIPTASAEPVGIATGTDGNLWFTEYNANKIGTLTTSGIFTEFPIASSSSQPDEMVAGPDGALWFTQHNTGQVGRISTSAALTEYPVPTANSLPAGIAVGSDGAIWFTETNTGKIGRIVAGTTFPPVLSIAKSHTGDFTAGEQGAAYTVTVSNAASAGPTNGTTVTVTETVPAGLTLVSMTGNGWTCPNLGNTCTSSDVVAGGGNYPDITVTVNVASLATTPQVNVVSVSGGGSGPATTSDSTVIIGSASIGTVNEYHVPISGTEPYGITSGPDGALWFTDWSGVIGRMTLTGSVTSVPDQATNPIGIVTGPDGAVWFCDSGGSKIGRITTDGIITEYATPTAGSVPHFIVVGPDGNLWFTEYSAGKIGKISTAGVITEYPLPHAYDNPQGIVVGPDGALWFAAYNPSSNYIGRITTGGAVTNAFAIPTNSAEPVGISAGADGNLWFTEYNANKIGKMTTAGVFVEYPIASSSSQPYLMVAGPDGALWFTQHNTGQIGRMTTSGLLTEYPIPTANSLPADITVGPDGAIWFTESNTGKIGRISTGYIDPPELNVAVSHVGFFAPGQQGVYTVTVSNLPGAGPTAGPVTVSDSVTSGLTLVSMAGTGWSCPNGGNTCTRNDPLAAGSNYPAITVTVNVASNAASPQVDEVEASGGGAATATASDTALITSALVGSVTEYKVPTAAGGPDRIASGPDGALWYTEFDGNKIGRLTTGGTFTEYAVPTSASKPSGITSGPDGALWFTEYSGNKIGTVTTGGVFHEYPIPTSGSDPLNIVTGPDGNLWFTEYGAGQIGTITPAGVITEYPLYHTYDNPQGITVGPDGALWFVAFNPSSNYVGRITTAGTLGGYDIPTSSSEPTGIATGLDGAIWFTEDNGNKIGRMTLDGSFTEYGIASSSSQPIQIVAGPDGAMWFTQYNSNQIGRITVNGVLVEYPVTTANSEPLGITVGSDGNIWFAEFNADKIGRIIAPGPVTAVLSIASTHTGNFMPSQQGARYTLTVSNATGAGSTSGTVTVTETVPPGIALVSLAGTGWTCAKGANTCTRADGIGSGESYPPVTATVNVTATMPEEVLNNVSVGVGGVIEATAIDPTVIGAYSPCDLTHAGITTIADVQAIINEALGAAAPLNDINGDGIVNVVDVLIAINAVLNYGCIA